MEKCKCCDSNLTVKQEEVYGCDVCKSEIDLNKPDNDYLELKVFSYEPNNVETFQLCSWGCVLEKLKTVKSDDFVALPFLFYNKKTSPKISAKEFLKHVKL